jgi:hypothetical protein
MAERLQSLHPARLELWRQLRGARNDVFLPALVSQGIDALLLSALVSQGIDAVFLPTLVSQGIID